MAYKLEENTIAVLRDNISFISSIELRFERGNGSNFKDAITLKVIQFDALMASKDTPKKYYKNLSVATDISRCRLCNCVTDPGHSKNLFRDSHRQF